jgi:VWFA-related protein
MTGEPHLGRIFFSRVLAGLVLFLAACALAQNSPLVQVTPAADTTSSKSLPNKAAAELTIRDEPTTFKVNVRLVLVRVVARDSQGHAVGNLHKEDFQLLDNGKQQAITQFSVEQSGTIASEQKATKVDATEKGTITQNAPERVAERFIALVFDDIHLEIQDLLPVRNAANRYVSSLQSSDRAAIFATSGHGNLDFTDDRTRLHEALLRLQPHSVVGSDLQPCPWLNYYMADAILNKADKEALDLATADVLGCHPGLLTVQEAQRIAYFAARREVDLHEDETHVTLASLKDAVRRISAMPGRRTIVLVSPGFLTPQLDYEVGDVIERALRANIVVNTLDARGLYVNASAGDIRPGSGPDVARFPQEGWYEMNEATASDDVLSTIADSTGGTFFHNSNDLEGGFKKTAEIPEYDYVLGFSPQNLKYDGRFHKLTVKLNNSTKLTLQARKGYYAPKQSANAEEQAKQEIEEALLSRDEMHDLPVELKTRFFKPTDLEAKLDVFAQIDVKQMHFRKEDGRNNETLTVAAALFDHNGVFIAGDKKIVDMRLKDETLERKLDRGVTLKTSFEVKPGSYLVRLVVRDAEGLLSAESGAIEIP